MSKYGITRKKLSEMFGVSEKTLNNWKNGGVIPRSKRYLIQKIHDELQNNAKIYTATNHSRIPLVSQYAQAGYLAGYADQEYMEQLPTVDFTPDREMTGNYVAFEVKGDSMDDGTVYSYLEGMIVICREVEPYLYKENKLHINKRDFVIVHTDGVLIKRITEHDVENHTITIHSLNPEYKDRVLDLADVKQIFSVVESRMQRRR